MILAAMLVTMLLVLIFFGALLAFVHRIAARLESIGGRGTSYLAKLRFGLRAIETETGHLPGALIALNDELGQVADGLGAIDGHLAATLDAAGRQGG